MGQQRGHNLWGGKPQTTHTSLLHTTLLKQTMAQGNDPGQWLGLLKWSLEYQDGTSECEAKEMSKEDRQWLTEAMAEMTVDEAKRMEEIVDRLEELRQSESPHADGEPAILFEELQDIVEQIDQALNLHKIGKFRSVVEMMRDKDPVFRAHAAEIVGTCTQNNPKVQEVAMK